MLSKGEVEALNNGLVSVNFNAPAANCRFVIFHFFGDRAHKLAARVNLEQLRAFQRPVFVEFFKSTRNFGSLFWMSKAQLL